MSPTTLLALALSQHLSGPAAPSGAQLSAPAPAPTHGARTGTPPRAPAPPPAATAAVAAPGPRVVVCQIPAGPRLRTALDGGPRPTHHPGHGPTRPTPGPAVVSDRGPAPPPPTAPGLGLTLR